MEPKIEAKGYQGSEVRVQRILICFVGAMVAIGAILFLGLIFTFYHPAPSFEVPSDLKVGMTVADLGRLHPEMYAVDQNVLTLEKLSKAKLAESKAFSGSIALLGYPSRREWPSIDFDNGKVKYIWNLDDTKLQKHLESLSTIKEIMQTLPDSIDLRKLPGPFNRYRVSLPAEQKKLGAFTGRLMNIKMDGIWDKTLNILFQDGKILQMSATVEKCGVCD